MRATEVIRGLLDIIDSIDGAEADCGCGGSCGCGDEPAIMVASNDDDEMRRFKQILGLVGTDVATAYANTPDEQVSDINSVTVDAGGGVNGPKHPDDIRGEHPRLFGGN